MDINIPGDKSVNKAKLILVDNKIDENTGMVPLRAEISNKEATFWPGQYVEPTLILKQEKNAILVPSKAINTGKKGHFVYVIDKENKASHRVVKTHKTFGEYTHVKGKLKKGDEVITRGQINVRPGNICEIVNKGKK